MTENRKKYATHYYHVNRGRRKEGMELVEVSDIKINMDENKVWVSGVRVCGSEMDKRERESG